ncbi:MAG: adenylate/guanylate cyclase domain-containing response regulator [Betaproteobacteria bacterium]|nr:adenylate/guanylate cyclase domain-containing response regulator [Betaproteobacteria bacterium]
MSIVALDPLRQTVQPQKAGTVLVVDEQDDTHALVAHAMRSLNMRVERASTGAEACQRIQLGDIDLVILHHHLLDASAFEVCGKIRGDPRAAAIPVIILAKFNARADRLAALRAGASEFLTKPIDREELLIRARMLLEQRSMHKALEDARARDWRQETDALRSTFKRYMSPAVADRVMHSGASSSERCADAIVLFADLRGFTRLSELLDPADLEKLLNEFFERMTRIVHRSGGNVYHFAGDALMAGFGVPNAQTDAAQRAVTCGIGMIAESQPMFERWARDYRPGRRPQSRRGHRRQRRLGRLHELHADR